MLQILYTFLYELRYVSYFGEDFGICASIHKPVQILIDGLNRVLISGVHFEYLQLFVKLPLLVVITLTKV